MALPAIPIITALGELANSWLEGYRKKREAKDERAAELLRQHGSWEEIMARGSTTSWKDEYLLILFSIPLILSFIPAFVGDVHAGFAALETTPAWYRAAIGIMVSASFGVRNGISLFTSVKAAKLAAEQLTQKAKAQEAIAEAEAKVESVVDRLKGK